MMFVIVSSALPYLSNSFYGWFFKINCHINFLFDIKYRNRCFFFNFFTRVTRRLKDIWTALMWIATFSFEHFGIWWKCRILNLVTVLHAFFKNMLLHISGSIISRWKILTNFKTIRPSLLISQSPRYDATGANFLSFTPSRGIEIDQLTLSRKCVNTFERTWDIEAQKINDW